ncbi:MAG: cupin domain-containing protein [Alphaproteobacteria bacterium]|nr:cupin domain-containing protein [Alphaproteobacteria bacterium]
MKDADEIIRALELAPHPEGGWFREVYRDPYSTAIYYLLKAGETSHWHRIAQSETWHYYAGAALELLLSADGNHVARHVLGPDVAKGERPQVTVPPRCWQAAKSLGAWSLAGCTVAPPFDFAGFELAPKGWQPGR